MIDFIQNNGKDFLIFLIIFWSVIREISHKWDKKTLQIKLVVAEGKVEEAEKAKDIWYRIYRKQYEEMACLIVKKGELIAELDAKKEIIEDFPERDPRTGRFTKRTK